jgi:hypothetical protein
MLNHNKKIFAIIVLCISNALLINIFINSCTTTYVNPYQVSFRYHDHPGRNPGYMVQFRPGYSLEAHLATLAIAIDPPTRKIENLDFVLCNIEADNEALDAIRADPGVEQVVCNYQQKGAESQVSGNSGAQRIAE